MGYENRDYYREENYQGGQPGLPGFSFNRQSVVFSLIVINAAIFLLDIFTPVIAPETHWLGDLLTLKTDRLWAIWNFLTYGFSHAPLDSKTSIMHVGFNMLALFILGPTVEQRLGKAEFLKFYLVAIVVSAIGWLLARLAFASGPSAIVGASGAVSAVVIYFVFLNPQAKLMIWGVIPAPAWIIGAMFLFMNLSTALRSTNVAWEAHLAGGAFGMLYYKLGWSFSGLQLPNFESNHLKMHQPDSEPDEKLQEEADRILKKISEHGESSLTRRELKTLNKYSKSIRKNRH